MSTIDPKFLDIEHDGDTYHIPVGGNAVIDDTAGSGDTDKAWSANKLVTELAKKIGGNKRVWYGTATSVDKNLLTVSVSNFNSLQTGDVFHISNMLDCYPDSGHYLFIFINDINPGIQVRTVTGEVIPQGEHLFAAGSSATFIYNGTYLLLVNGTHASTTTYGTTKLENSSSSSSTTTALVPAALKSVVDNRIAPLETSVAGKADKDTDAVEGNFAEFDSSGNPVDSGHKHSDYLTSHQDISGKADKVSGATAGNFAGLDSNGNLTDSGSKASDFLTEHQDISGKADKVSDATSGNFAGLDGNGNLTDSGSKASDFLTEHQDISGKADKVSGATSGNFAGLDANGNLTDSGSKASDFLTEHQDISGKADKDTDAVEGNLAEFDSNGNPVDSGKSANDFLETSAIDDTAGTGDTNKTWSADKLANENTLTATLDTPAAIQTFTDGAEWPMEMEIAIEPVQSGTGDPSPSNERPITGWDGANVTTVGKNKLPITLSKLKAINTSGTWNGNRYNLVGVTYTIEEDKNGFITSIETKGTASGDNSTFRLMNNVTYDDFPYAITESGCPSGGGSNTYRIQLQLSSSPYTNVGTDTGSGFTYTVPNNGNKYNLFIRVNNGVSADDLVFRPMVRVSTDTDTTFEPYMGENYTITFPSSTGTVYGGTLKVNPDGTGTLTVNMAEEVVDGTKVASISAASGTDADGGKRINISIANAKYVNNATPIVGKSDKLTPASADSIYVGGTNKFAVLATSIGIRFAGASTTEEAKTALNANPVQIVYELATPVTYTISAPQVLSLLGQNNVWADCGNINSLSYVRRQDIGFIREDTAGQIRAATNPIREELGDAESALSIVIDGDTAPKNITAGQYLFIKNHSTLATGAYHATAAIASGANVTGNNTEPDADGFINSLLAMIQSL